MNSPRFFSILVFATLVFAGHSARASIFIEPFAGYSMGTYAYGGYYGSSLYSDTAKDFPAAGSVVGGRLGVGMLGLSLGGQYSMGNYTLKGKNHLENKENYKMSTADIGAFVNLSLPFFRIWATYFFSSTAKVKDVEFDADGAANPIAEENGTETLKGGGTEVGVGFTGIPFLAINLSMTNMSYDDIDHPVQVTNTVKIKDVDFTTYMLSVSVPLSF